MAAAASLRVMDARSNSPPRLLLELFDDWLAGNPSEESGRTLGAACRFSSSSNISKTGSGSTGSSSLQRHMLLLSAAGAADQAALPYFMRLLLRARPNCIAAFHSFQSSDATLTAEFASATDHNRNSSRKGGGTCEHTTGTNAACPRAALRSLAFQLARWIPDVSTALTILEALERSADADGDNGTDSAAPASSVRNGDRFNSSSLEELFESLLAAPLAAVDPQLLPGGRVVAVLEGLHEASGSSGARMCVSLYIFLFLTIANLQSSNYNGTVLTAFTLPETFQNLITVFLCNS